MAQMYHDLRGMMTQLPSQTEPHPASGPRGRSEMLGVAHVIGLPSGNGSCACDLHISQPTRLEFRLPLSLLRQFAFSLTS